MLIVPPNFFTRFKYEEYKCITKKGDWKYWKDKYETLVEKETYYPDLSWKKVWRHFFGSRNKESGMIYPGTLLSIFKEGKITHTIIFKKLWICRNPYIKQITFTGLGEHNKSFILYIDKDRKRLRFETKYY